MKTVYRSISPTADRTIRALLTVPNERERLQRMLRAISDIRADLVSQTVLAIASEGYEACKLDGPGHEKGIDRLLSDLGL